MPVIDNAIYQDGKRIGSPATLQDTFEALGSAGGFAWIGLYRPTDAEMQAVASEFGLHPLAVEDALTGHQRAKIERYGETLFAVLRPAHYDDTTEEVSFGEVHVFVGPTFVVTVRLAEAPDIAGVRARLEAEQSLLARGPEAVLYALLDRVVDDYEPVVAGIENDIDEIEDQLFAGRSGDDDLLSRRIYELYGETLAFARAVHPLIVITEQLHAGFDKYEVDLELRRALRDVADHVAKVDQMVDGFRALLDKALTVHSTIVSQRQAAIGLAQNEQVKKISSWAAIIFAPGLVTGIYGMNFEFMPELQWPLGYPFALSLMALFAGGLYAIFRARKWL